MSSSKGFGSQKPKVRKKLCIDIANQIKKQLHPNGQPPNMRTTSWIDYQTGDLVFADITDRPDLWHLPAFDVESKKRYDSKMKEGN